MKRIENYEIVLNGKEVRVIIEPLSKQGYSVKDILYDVLLQGKRVGVLWRSMRNRFFCKNLETKEVFGGTTRRDAANSMIYGTYKK